MGLRLPLPIPLALAAALAAGAARAEQPAGEPPPAVRPCEPAPGETTPGPCSPAPDTPRDPSQVGAEMPTGPPRTPVISVDAPEPDLTTWTGWADERHGRFEEGLSSVVQRIDAFFGDPSHIQFDPAASRVRLRLGVRTGQDDPFEPELGVLADVRLPSLDRLLKRARLFVSGGDDDVPQTGTEQDLVPRRFDTSVATGRGAAELRFDLYRVRRTLVDLGGGVRFRLPVPPYARARVAHAEELGLGLVGHVNQTVFWERDVGYGESTRVDVERVFAPFSVARTWAIATLHERSRGLEWSGETGLAQGIDRRTGIYFAAGLDGATRSRANVDEYRVFTRLRRDVHQGWLYLELEPEVSWPIDALGDRSRVLAITVRTEVQFASRGR